MAEKTAVTWILCAVVIIVLLVKNKNIYDQYLLEKSLSHHYKSAFDLSVAKEIRQTQNVKELKDKLKAAEKENLNLKSQINIMKKTKLLKSNENEDPFIDKNHN